jgi:uncharacterized protein YgbK (DUF1537 family)
VIQALDVHDQAVVTIGQPLRQEPGLPQRLSGHLAAAVSRVLGRRDVHCLYVEGGATAAALVRNLEWRRLHVERELAPGVIRLRVASRSAPRLVIKPGSYPWPDEALRRWG